MDGLKAVPFKAKKEVPFKALKDASFKALEAAPFKAAFLKTKKRLLEKSEPRSGAEACHKHKRAGAPGVGRFLP